MKVLFISRSKNGAPSPIVKSQGESLKKLGIGLEYFLITRGGISGYLKSIRELRIFIKSNRFSLYHAHYSLSGIVAAFAGCRPLIVSLMGSDTKAGSLWRLIIRTVSNLFWKAVIVKSEDMKRSIRMSKAIIIPNGVSIDMFQPMDKDEQRNKLNWCKQKDIILFPANPARKEKNFQLFENALNHPDLKNKETRWLEDVDFERMPLYYNASDVIVMTSLWEGSPNAVKEAMACNKPVVSTNVGDVKWLFGDMEGYFICDFDPVDVAKSIKRAFTFLEEKKMTNGRKRIQSLGLDAQSISKRILGVYSQVV